VLKVVVDSNIWISALLVAGGKSRELVARFALGEFTVIYPNWLLDEIRNTLSKPRLAKRITADDISNIISLIEEQGILVEPSSLPTVSRDPNDDAFLACALQSQADYIVTGDGDLLVIGEYHGTKIIPVADFLEILTGGKS